MNTRKSEAGSRKILAGAAAWAVAALAGGMAWGQAAATQPGATSMPAGHMAPDASVIPGHPMKQQAPSSGALCVVVTQGTKDAAAIGQDSVKVELLAKGVVVKTYHAMLDEKGTTELHELPLDPPFQPIVTVIHGGVEEQMIGPPMHRYQPAIQMDVKVYESTTEKPAWTVGIRQITAKPEMVEGQLVLQVVEMVGAFDPADRAWVGEKVNGVQQTVAIGFPAEAEHLVMGPGLAEAGAKIIDGKVVRGKAMLPGQQQYVFGYDIPIKDGRASLSFVARAPTTLFALYVPGDAKIDGKDGLDVGVAGGKQAEDNRLLLKARTMKSGQVATVQLSGLKAPPPVTTRPVEVIDQNTDLNLPVPQPRKESK